MKLLTWLTSSSPKNFTRFSAFFPWQTSSASANSVEEATRAEISSSRLKTAPHNFILRGWMINLSARSSHMHFIYLSQFAMTISRERDKLLRGQISSLEKICHVRVWGADWFVSALSKKKNYYPSFRFSFRYIPFYKILQCQLSGRAARATFPLIYYLRIFFLL